MSEQAIADFVATFIPDTATHAEPVRGRVVMSKRRIVLATDDSELVVPIRSVFDVRHATVPGDLADLFDDTVTIAHERDGEKRIAVVEGGGDTVDRFVRLVFKALLNGASVRAKHPARVGGRVTDEPFASGSLFLDDETVGLGGDIGAQIVVSTVTHFERVERVVGDLSRPVLSVRHMGDSGAATTELALDSNRRMNLLGRFLRLNYTQLKQELTDVSLTEDEVEVLVATYSTGPDVSLAGVLGIDASHLTMLLNDLVEKGFVDDDDGVELTSLGQAAVSEHIEDVNV